MATNKKISQLTAATSVDGTEVVPIVQGGANRKCTLNQMSALTNRYEPDEITIDLTPSNELEVISIAGVSGEAADPQTPKTHASSHENGGADEISVEGLSGLLNTRQTPTLHASSHEPGGSDEMDVDAASDVASLRTLGSGSQQACSGTDSRLSNNRTPTSHATSHKNAGGDEVGTATPAANAIPKAGDGGTLSTDWIPVMGGDVGAGGSKGLVPAPSTGDATKFLRGDATWVVASGLPSGTSEGQLLTTGVSPYNFGLTTAPTTPAASGKAAAQWMASADDQRALMLQGRAGQSASIFEVQKSDGTVWVSVASTGVLNAASGVAASSTTTGSLVVTGGLGVSGSAYIGGNLFLPAGYAQINRDGITTTSTDGAVLANDTASLVGTPVQYSPRLRFRTHVWDTNDANDDTWDYWCELRPVSGTTTRADLYFMASKNGAAAVQQVQITGASAGGSTTLAVSGLVSATSTISTSASVVSSRNNIVTSSTDGFVASNTTASTVGTQVQMSPRLRFASTAWDTGSGGSSKTINWINEVLPTGGISPTTSILRWGVDQGVASYTYQMSLSNLGVLSLAGNVASSSYTTGTLVVTGGLGVSGSVYLGGNLFVPAGYGKINRDSIAVTSTDGLVLANDTPGDGSTHNQWSPRLRFRGHTANSTPTDSSWDCVMELQTFYSGTAHYGTLYFKYSKDEAAYTNGMWYGFGSALNIYGYAGVILTGNGCFTTNHTNRTTVSADGAALVCITASTSGVPVQMSPRLRFTGTAWDTTPTASSKTINWIEEVLPSSGSPTTSILRWGVDQGVASYTYQMSLSNLGVLALAGNVASSSYTTGTLVVTGGLGVSGATYLHGAFTTEDNAVIAGSGKTLGFFGAAGTTIQSVTDQAAWADVIDGTDHVTRSDLNTKMQAIRDKLQTLIDALQAHGLVAAA